MEEGLSDRIEVRLQDYRHVEGIFDKFVSIGMIEHVGKEQYHSLARSIDGWLTPTGLGLIHTIGSSENPSVPTEPWTEKYIFPGYRLARLSELTDALDASGFIVAHVENLKPHYAQTLRHWKTNFDENREKVLALGQPYDHRFLRMWNYYLQGAEAGFRYGKLQLYQILFCKGDRWKFPLRLDFHGH